MYCFWTSLSNTLLRSSSPQRKRGGINLLTKKYKGNKANTGTADGIKKASLDKTKKRACSCLVARMQGKTVYLIQFSSINVLV
jgi:hypothetical protein